jgi:hypothetical protein
MTDHQQAREAAARLAYPDEGWHNQQHTGAWGRQIQAQRLNSYNHNGRKGGDNRGVPEWTDQHSQQALEAKAQRAVATKAHTLLTCPQCGEQFTLPNHVARRSLNRKTKPCCSIKCRSQAQQATLVTKQCVHCHGPFQVKTYDVKKGQMYCSHACHNTARTRNR